MEQVDFFKGYDYITHGKDTLKESYLQEFVNGIQSLSNKDQFLFEQGRSSAPALTNENIERIIEQEINSMVSPEEDNNDIPFEVQLGLRPMGLLTYSFNQHLYDWIINGITKSTNPEKLTANQLSKIIETFPATPDTISNHKRKFTKLNNHMQAVILNSMGEAANLGLYIDAVTSIFQIYEECAVLQSKSKKDREAIGWNIRVGCTLYIDDPRERAEYAALQYLREPALLQAQQRPPTSPRTRFDNLRINSAYDEFRLNVARLHRTFDEDKTLLVINGDLETYSYAKYYNTLNPKQKRAQDQKEQQIIDQVREKYPHLQTYSAN